MPRKATDKEKDLMHLWSPEQRRFFTPYVAQKIKEEKCQLCGRDSWEWVIHGMKLCPGCKETTLFSNSAEVA